MSREAVPCRDIPRLRLGLRIQGLVQGVGFRPYIYKLARRMGLSGWVRNDAQGVSLEVEGEARELERFREIMLREKPPTVRFEAIIATELPPLGFTPFEIRESRGGERTAAVLPDLATCADCFREIFDPCNRRYRYPFTNCTHCGPRFSIVESLPYDRPNTSMKTFAMCEACLSEYHDPADRRFHAQANACPTCGPRLEFWAAEGKSLALGEEALQKAVAAVRRGEILAVKGLGGFHLWVDARDEAAVRRLRERKARPDKPFAVMAPDLGWVEENLQLNEPQRRCLCSTESPIVLLSRKKAAVSDEVAPGHPDLGVMLPYTPLHRLLLSELEFPVVATSGNLSEEPICTEEAEAVLRLKGIADLFLVHNRPIVRAVEDSVVQFAAGREMILRRARGYAPLSRLASETGPVLLALGGHLKNTVALGFGDQIRVSQFVGDLQTEQARRAFHRTIQDLKDFHEVSPEYLVRDLHPDYATTLESRMEAVPVLAVQHHHAHVAAVMAEHGLTGEVLGIAWDGAGYGPDGTIWGGEFLLATLRDFRRLAHLRTFPLPGGEKAMREPRRSALGMIFEIFGEEHQELLASAARMGFAGQDRKLLLRMLSQDLNCPRTSSAGRLFDAVAALLGLRLTCSYEGQAAQELMFAAERVSADECFYPIPLRENESGPILDWAPLVKKIGTELRSGTEISRIARRFHRGLAEAVCDIAKRAAKDQVVLGGGCFQNRLLTEMTVACLEKEGFRVFWPRNLPPNDGGLSFGQLAVARARMKGGN